MNQIKTGAFLSYLTLLTSVVVTLFYTPILIKQLGQSEYGVYTLIAAFIGYLTILDMGLGNAIVRYIARTRSNNDKETESKLSGLFLILFSFLGILVAIIGFILYKQLDNLFGAKMTIEEMNLAKTLTFILVLNFSLSFPLSVFGAIVQAHERFIFLKFTNIIKVLITPFIIIPLLLLGNGSVMVVAVTTILNLLFLLLNVYYAFFKLKVKVTFGNFDKQLIKEIVIYSAFIFLNAIMDKLYWSTDQIILGAFSGINQVAIYAIGMQFITLYMSIATAISGLYLPKVSLMEKNKSTDKEFSDLFINIGHIQALIIFYVIGGFIAIGKDFISLWLSETYLKAYWVAVVIFIPLSVIWTQTIGIPILQAKNRHKFRSIVYLITAIFNIFITIPLATKYGELGAAITTAFFLTISHIIIMNIYYYKIIKIDIISFYKKIFPPFVILSITVIVTLLLNKEVTFVVGWIKIILLILLYTVTYVVLCLFLDKETRNRLKRTLVK